MPAELDEARAHLAGQCPVVAQCPVAVHQFAQVGKVLDAEHQFAEEVKVLDDGQDPACCAAGLCEHTQLVNHGEQLEWQDEVDLTPRFADDFASSACRHLCGRLAQPKLVDSGSSLLCQFTSFSTSSLAQHNLLCRTPVAGARQVTGSSSNANAECMQELLPGLQPLWIPAPLCDRDPIAAKAQALSQSQSSLSHASAAPPHPARRTRHRWAVVQEGHVAPAAPQCALSQQGLSCQAQHKVPTEHQG